MATEKSTATRGANVVPIGALRAAAIRAQCDREARVHEMRDDLERHRRWGAVALSIARDAKHFAGRERRKFVAQAVAGEPRAVALALRRLVAEHIAARHAAVVVPFRARPWQ